MQDLIIWPEKALPIFPENIPDIIEMLSKKGSDTSTVLLIGAPTKDVTGADRDSCSGEIYYPK